MSDLAAFLRARLDEKERWLRGERCPLTIELRREWLREVEAHRAILAEYEQDDPMRTPDWYLALSFALEAMAAVYAGHPDYDEGWTT